MEEVDLAPFERAFGTCRCVGSARLDTLHVADMLDHVGRAIAAIMATSQSEGQEGSEPAYRAQQLHSWFGCCNTRTWLPGASTAVAECLLNWDRPRALYHWWLYYK